MSLFSSFLECTISKIFWSRVWLIWVNFSNRRYRMNQMRNVGNLSGRFLLAPVCFRLIYWSLGLSQRRRNRNPRIKRVVHVLLLVLWRRRRLRKLVHPVGKRNLHRVEDRGFGYIFLIFFSLCYDLLYILNCFFCFFLHEHYTYRYGIIYIWGSIN